MRQRSILVCSLAILPGAALAQNTNTNERVYPPAAVTNEYYITTTNAAGIIRTNRVVSYGWPDVAEPATNYAITNGYLYQTAYLANATIVQTFRYTPRPDGNGGGGQMVNIVTNPPVAQSTNNWDSYTTNWANYRLQADGTTVLVTNKPVIEQVSGAVFHAQRLYPDGSVEPMDMDANGHGREYGRAITTLSNGIPISTVILSNGIPISTNLHPGYHNSATQQSN